YVNMVAAGEAGGILDTILMRLAVFMEKNDALVRKVKGAMIYPGVIMSVAGIAITVLLVFVIPTFQTMFESAHIPLPFMTRLVIDLSHGLKTYWRVVVGVIGGGLFFLKRVSAWSSATLALDSLLRKAPV